MKKRIIIITVILLGCIAGGCIYYFVWYKHFSLRSKVIASVKKVLKDPTSAQFKNIKYDSKYNVECGYVNAKNSLGGYTGFKPFLIYGKGIVKWVKLKEVNTNSTNSRETYKKLGILTQKLGILRQQVRFIHCEK